MKDPTSLEFSSNMDYGEGMVLYQCSNSLGKVCSHSLDCKEPGSGCQKWGSVWLDGQEEEDRLGKCVCNSNHREFTAKDGKKNCRPNTRQVGEDCSGSKQCQKVRAVCRKEGEERRCACLSNKKVDNKGNNKERLTNVQSNYPRFLQRHKRSSKKLY